MLSESWTSGSSNGISGGWSGLDPVTVGRVRAQGDLRPIISAHQHGRTRQQRLASELAPRVGPGLAVPTQFSWR